MPSTYTTSLGLTLPATGELSGTWGSTVNNGVTSLLDAAVAGTTTISISGSDYTLTTTQGAANEARRMFLIMTGAPGAARNVIVPDVSKLYFVHNNTSGGFAQTVKTAAGVGISVPNGARMALYCNGTDVVQAMDTINNLSYTGTFTGGTGVVNLGSGQFYKATSGFVGFGTASPASPVSVYSTTASSVADVSVVQEKSFPSFINFERYQSDAAAGVVNLTKSRGTAAAPTAVQTSDGAGTIAFNAFAGSNVRAVANISSVVQSYVSDTNISGNLVFSTNNQSTTPVERMRLSAEGFLGIGTTNPTSALTIQRTGVTPVFDIFTEQNAEAYIRRFGSVNPGMFFSLTRARGTISAPVDVQTGDACGALSFRGYQVATVASGTPYNQTANIRSFVEDVPTASTISGNMVFSTTFNSGTITEKMRLTAAGNFGINDSNPPYLLYANGTFGCAPGSSVTPANNGDVVIQATNNTTLTFKLKGSDGVVRSANLTLS